MALQLTGAAKKDSIANLQIRLPVVVIGGGLTAIDTATESLAYYPLQVEKFLARHEILAAERGEAAVFAAMNDEERGIAREFIAHAQAIRAERAAAEREGRRARHCRAGERLGRRHHRLPQAADRFAVLHPQPRGSAEGAGGGHPLRRRPVAGRDRGRCQRPCQRAQGGGRAERPEDRGDLAGAHHPGGGRHPAQHRAGARGCDARLHRRQVFPRARRGGQSRHAGAGVQAGRRARADVSRRRRPLHVVLRRPASVLRRQRREGDGRRQAGLSRC